MTFSPLSLSSRFSVPHFRSFWMGGFECSTHRRRDGERLDLLAATRHDEFARQDYERLRALDIKTARDGVRWHKIETRPGFYDWSSVLPQLRAARETRLQVIWDLLHYGWPDDLNPWSDEFVQRFARFAGAFARLHEAETGHAPWLCPINEPSFLAWAGGEVAYINPFEEKRGSELKFHIVWAAIEASRAILDACPRATLFHIDPILRTTVHPEREWERDEVEAYERSQWDAVETLMGRQNPQMGGREDYVHVVGLNYYIHNQGVAWGELLPPGHPDHEPLRVLLSRAQTRLQRSIFLSETGIEGAARPAWLRYVGNESRALLRDGVPLLGACLYPILNHPGWDDERHCHNGLWDYADDAGHREAYAPLEDELCRQQELMHAQMRGKFMPDDEIGQDELSQAAQHMDELAGVRGD